jgi:pimeloyl-ACP methyl ester carboxylesterase
MTGENETMSNSGIGDRRLDRRAVLGGATGAAAAGLVARLGTPIPSAAQDATPAAQGGRATFVLVHGSWAGAWIWKKVIPLLRVAGHDVYATTATGMGDRVHHADPAINLDVYIDDVVNVLEYEDLHDVTLVGWSFGGWMITGAAERVPERVKQLVYLEGAVPQDGQSNYDEYTEEGIGFEYRAGVEAGWPGFEVVHAGAEEFVRSLTKDPADQEWVLSKLTPQPMAVSAQPIKLGNPAAAALPRTYVFCTEGKGTAEEDPFVAFVNGLRADPAWQVVDLADNHLAPVNAPQLTAEALLSLV